MSGEPSSSGRLCVRIAAEFTSRQTSSRTPVPWNLLPLRRLTRPPPPPRTFLLYRPCARPTRRASAPARSRRWGGGGSSGSGASPRSPTCCSGPRARARGAEAAALRPRRDRQRRRRRAGRHVRLLRPLDAHGRGPGDGGRPGLRQPAVRGGGPPVTLCGNQISGAPRHRRGVVP